MLRGYSSVALAVLVAGSVLGARQAGPDPAKILALAKAGRGSEAWQIWAAQPRTPAVLRLGIALAIETKELRRGIDLYGELATREQRPDRSALTDLALAAAEDVAGSIDVEARITACGAAVGLRAAHETCRRALSALASNSPDPDERAWAAFALADAGVPPRADDLGVAEGSMGKNMRRRIAQTMVHLTPAVRVRLLEPLLEETSMPAQYATLLLLGDIPGVEAEHALRSAQARMPSGPPKVAILLGLARHGDRSSVAALGDLLPSLGEYEKIQAGRALARAADARGLALLDAAIRSPVDIDRIAAAEALADVDPDRARKVTRDNLTAGSPAIRQRSLLMAGSLELGTDPSVYRWLSDDLPLVRSAAIGAIRDTFAIQDARPKIDRQ
jgi:HEAT repeat protein